MFLLLPLDVHISSTFFFITYFSNVLNKVGFVGGHSTKQEGEHTCVIILGAKQSQLESVTPHPVSAL